MLYRFKKIKLLALPILLIVIACTTVPRPDLGAVKNNGKQYEYVQDKVVGIPIGKPRLNEVPSAMQETQDVIRVPAKWLLWVTLPASMIIAVIGAVAVVWLQDKKLARLCMIASISLFLVAMLSSAWLIATYTMKLFIPLVAIIVSGVIYLLYRLTLGKHPKDILRKNNDGQ